MRQCGNMTTLAVPLTISAEDASKMSVKNGEVCLIEKIWTTFAWRILILQYLWHWQQFCANGGHVWEVHCHLKCCLRVVVCVPVISRLSFLWSLPAQSISNNPLLLNVGANSFHCPLSRTPVRASRVMSLQFCDRGPAPVLDCTMLTTAAMDS